MNRSLNILLIEDDTVEVMKFNRVLSKLELKHKIVQSSNGEDALEILKVKQFIPEIIILDLNMPKLSGIEFLTILKADEILKYIPAIVLSTSTNHRDLLECYNIGIAGYILKPLKYEDYVRRINRLLDYWSVNELISQ
jgi:CheY-like chemotaxis protein